jgi:8-oxo-dGTP diphosphatase
VPFEPVTYRSPALTVDVVIEHGDGIVLIERRNPPHGYALPGGFVDYGETVEAAAVREAMEETSLSVTLRALLGVYSDPSRDARQHTVSTVFIAEGRGSLKAADDAKHAFVVASDALPTPLCFDHARILADYRAWQQHGLTPAPRLLLTEADRHTLGELAWQTLAAMIAVPISSVRPALRSGPLSQPGACHVALRTKRGELRGSAGSTEPRTTLALAVEEMTAAAALSAPHAPILRSELPDLRIEISVLGASTDVIIATND